MNTRQRKFCDEYLISGNATDAAIKAGYSPKTAKSIGQRLLTFVDLKQYIDTELEKLHSAKIADAQEVLEYLTAVMRGEHTEQVLKLAGDGIQTITDMTFFLFGLTMITPSLIVRFVTTPKKCGMATRRKRWRRWKSSKPMAFTGISIKMIC